MLRCFLRAKCFDSVDVIAPKMAPSNPCFLKFMLLDSPLHVESGLTYVTNGILWQ